MPKVDPRGEAPNPIRAKLANDICRPLPVAREPVVVVDLPRTLPESAPIAPVAKMAVVPEPPSPPVISTPEASVPRADEPRETVPAPCTKLTKTKKVLFTVEEQRENDALLRVLASVTGAETLGWSHVNRAVWSLLRQAHDRIAAGRPTAPRLARPSNGNPIELARFEDTLAQYLLALFKEMPRQPRW